MKVKTCELVGLALNWAVAKAIMPSNDDGWLSAAKAFKYSQNWAEGGPIIEREGICLYFNPEDAKHYEWSTEDRSHAFYLQGSTPLIAAMRCYVASKLGDDVEIPEELL